MRLFDLIRYWSLLTFGIGSGFMLLINIISFRVLRPPKTLGFLWWHVTAISVSFACLGYVCVQYVGSKLGDPPTYLGGIVLVGTTLFAVSQVLIFNVERSRLVQKRALEQAAGEQ